MIFLDPLLKTYALSLQNPRSPPMTPFMDDLPLKKEVRCQFQQHYTSSFFVWKCFEQLLSTYSLCWYFFGKIILAEKLVVKCSWNWLQETNTKSLEITAYEKVIRMFDFFGYLINILQLWSCISTLLSDTTGFLGILTRVIATTNFKLTSNIIFFLTSKRQIQWKELFMVRGPLCERVQKRWLKLWRQVCLGLNLGCLALGTRWYLPVTLPAWKIYSSFQDGSEVNKHSNKLTINLLFLRKRYFGRML